nr:recombinase zinc beta ribbon domain-containing protein [Pseudoflavonifractor phocaeensis]
MVQKKTYTPDYLTHQKKYNYGAEEKVCLTDHHEAIIDRDLWNTVQAELARRNRHGQLGVGHGNRYVFSGKIKCGLCGNTFVSKTKHYPSGKSTKKWNCFTALHEGRNHIDPAGNEVGCDIGQLLRDDFAHEVLNTATGAVLTSHRWAAGQITACTKAEIQRSETTGEDNAEKLEYEIQQVKQKKEGILDAFFSKDITKEEMRWMNERYDCQLGELQAALRAARERDQLSYETETLQSDVKAHLKALLGREVDEPFQKEILDAMIVYPGRHLEVRLNLLPAKWRFVLDAIAHIRRQSGCHDDPSVPISVRRACNSG